MLIKSDNGKDSDSVPYSNQAVTKTTLKHSVKTVALANIKQMQTSVLRKKLRSRV